MTWCKDWGANKMVVVPIDAGAFWLRSRLEQAKPSRAQAQSDLEAALPAPGAAVEAAGCCFALRQAKGP